MTPDRVRAVADRLLEASKRVSFEEAGHVYRATSHGGTLVSVTGVLRAFWPDDFARVPAATLEHKRQIGSAAHLATHYHDRGVLDEATVADDVRPYLEAWRAFRAERQPIIVATELRLLHPGRGYAGTIDKLVYLPGYDDLVVADLKTGDPATARTHLQTAGYAELVRAALSDTAVTAVTARPVAYSRVHRASVRLLPDGTYRMTPYPERADWRKFAALLDALSVLREESRHVAVA